MYNLIGVESCKEAVLQRRVLGRLAPGRVHVASSREDIHAQASTPADDARLRNIMLGYISSTSVLDLKVYAAMCCSHEPIVGQAELVARFLL